MIDGPGQPWVGDGPVGDRMAQVDDLGHQRLSRPANSLAPERRRRHDRRHADGDAGGASSWPGDVLRPGAGTDSTPRGLSDSSPTPTSARATWCSTSALVTVPSPHRCSSAGRGSSRSSCTRVGPRPFVSASARTSGWRRSMPRTSASLAARSTSSPTRRGRSRMPLLKRLLHPASRLVRADLLLKRSATRRWVDAATANGHRLRAGPTVPRRAFRPSPPTDGRVLVIERAADRPPATSDKMRS